MAAGAMAATGVTAAAAVVLGNRRWRWWLDGRKRAGQKLHVCGGYCARARVGGARTF